MASRIERNAAAAAAAAAQTAATCPWGVGDTSETASNVSSRAPSSRNTCPWGAEEAPLPKTKRSVNKTPQSTCPWGPTTNDMHTAQLQKAADRRQRGSPKNYGAAGSGAPKASPLMSVGMTVAQNCGDIPPRARDEGAENTQRMEPAAMPCMQPFPTDSAMSGEGAPMPGAGGDDDDEDEEQQEQREIINQCLAEGLSEDKILEILEEWSSQKLVERTRERLQAEQAAVADPSSADQEALGSSRRGSGSSITANRQAKAKKSLSFGPMDEEIVGVLKDFSKENLTPPESPPNSLGLAAKRKKEREISEAKVGSFDEEKSRAAYLETKKQMDAVKNKNRLSSGIF